MADRSHHKIDSSHDRMDVLMQSSTERDSWKRVFPDPVPMGHRLVHRWEGMKLSIWTEPDPEKIRMTSEGKPAEKTDAERLEELKAMPEADLLTKGVELGLAITKRQTKAAMAAQILDKQKEVEAKAKAAAPPPK